MNYLRRHALVPTLLLTLAALLSYVARVAYTDGWVFLFLPRNLVLAGIPVAIALVAAGVQRTRATWLAYPLLVGWLLFLPNSVYLVTDLIHLRERPGIPLVYDSAMCGTFAAAGVLAGVSSLSIVEEVLRHRLGRWLSHTAVVPVLLLNGLGVWMGRYQRWNSWDVASEPTALFRAVWTPLVHPSIHLWGIALTYAGLLGVCWLAWVSVRPKQAVPSRPLASAQRR